MFERDPDEDSLQHVAAIRRVTGPRPGRLQEIPSRGGRRHCDRLDHVRRDQRRATIQPIEPDQRTKHRPTRPAVGSRTRHDARTGSNTARLARRDLHNRRVERGLCAERQDWRSPLDLRSPGASCSCPDDLLRRCESRSCALQRQSLSRHAGWTVDRAGCQDRKTRVGCHHRGSIQALFDYRRSANRQGQGAHRECRLRVRSAGLPFRLRCRVWKTYLAYVHRAGQSRTGLRVQGHGSRRENVERTVVGGRRRRHAVGLHRLRSRPRSRLHRHGQRSRVVSEICAARAEATICTWLRSWRSAQATASWFGIIR